jgi:hypothetical protein
MPAARDFQTKDERAEAVDRHEAAAEARRRSGKTKPGDRSEVPCAKPGCSRRVTYASLMYSPEGEACCSRQCAGFSAVQSKGTTSLQGVAEPDDDDLDSSSASS